MWIEVASVPTTAGHTFYQRLNKLLESRGFDQFAEEMCRRFYVDVGRPGLAPDIYFRLLLIGYFEGIDGEHGIAGRAADSFALRASRTTRRSRARGA
jgi:transposase